MLQGENEYFLVSEVIQKENMCAMKERARSLKEKIHNPPAAHAPLTIHWGMYDINKWKYTIYK